MLKEDRGKVKRITGSNWETYLADVKGERYTQYRKNFNEAQKNQIIQDKPLQLNVELTSYCNLKCKMCYYSYKVNKTRKQMSMELIDRIVEEAKDLKIDSIFLGAFSEGLLHKNINEVLYKFSEINPLDYWFVTNGTMLSKEIAETMVNIPLTMLSVSLDAATPEKYKKIRGANLDNVEKNIYDFLNIREKKNSRLPFLRVSFVDMEDNHEELEMFYEKWGGVADIIDVQTYTDFSDKDYGNSALNTEFKCGNPFYLISIKYDGELYPCCCGNYCNEEKIYLQETSLYDYWKSDFHKQLIESLKTKQYKECCMECVKRTTFNK